MNAVKKYALYVIIGLLAGGVGVAVLCQRVYSGRLRVAEADYTARIAAVESRSEQLAERIGELEGQLTDSLRNAAELRNQLDASRRIAEQLRSENSRLREAITASELENKRLGEAIISAAERLDAVIGAGGNITDRIERIENLIREL